MMSATPEDQTKMLSQMMLTLERLSADFAQVKSEISAIKERMPSLMIDAYEGWLDTTPAAAALATEGVKSPKHLKRLAAIGLFTWDEPGCQGSMRDIGTPQKPRYQFHIPSCKEPIRRYLAMSPEERDRIYGQSDAA